MVRVVVVSTAGLFIVLLAHATEPASGRWAGMTRAEAVEAAQGPTAASGGSIPEPTIVKQVSYYDCQKQYWDACPGKRLLRAWYIYWVQEPVRGCVYVSNGSVVVGQPCRWR